MGLAESWMALPAPDIFNGTPMPGSGH